MEKEKKIELECDYCGVPITENDHKCPNCGANCTEKIKKYKKQKEEITEEERRKRTEQSQQLANDLGKTFKIPMIAGVALFILFVAIGVFSSINASRSFNEKAGGNQKESSEKVKYNSNVGFNEVGESADYSVILDSYELYIYVSDDFPSHYNTPDGYQKIAFHFVLENKQDDKEYISSSDVQLKADGYKVESANLKIGSFERVEVGQASYISILNTYVDAGEKIQGYVGYLVPKNTKELKFTFGDVKITMDNPAYQG